MERDYVTTLDTAEEAAEYVQALREAGEDAHMEYVRWMSFDDLLVTGGHVVYVLRAVVPV